MKVAAAYIRVSTDDQLEYSPDSQLEKIRLYAERNQILLPKEFIFVDEGISGRKTKNRPAFNEMIGLAKRNPKPFDVILVWKFSRFARNREDSIVYKSMLKLEKFQLSNDEKVKRATYVLISSDDENSNLKR